uniref:Leucine rich repeat transmembrane neuronal 1 n=1 Tax=Sinocyclocheilus anshuiensis TaxID=1608454 RepID=A0A671P8I5_9TELE
SGLFPPSCMFSPARLSHRSAQQKPPGLILCSLGIVLKIVPLVGGSCPRPCRCDNKLLYCEGLNLTDIPQNLSSAIGLSLRENNISELREGDFVSLSQLTWLYLDHNNIEIVEENAFERLRRVKELDLSTNRIEILPNGTFRPLPNLRILDLSYNRLQSLEPDLFHGLRKLTNLHLRYNALKFIPVLARNSFAGLFKLTELHLEHNELVKVNLAHFPRLISLRTLYMRNNKATIVKIDFSNNEIEYIEPHVFESVPNLNTLMLDSNKLTYIDQRILDS